jgi:hypothetical protein
MSMRPSMWALRVVLATGFAVGLLGQVSHAAEGTFSTGSADPLVKEINDQIRAVWTENEITPSSTAEDAEWVRRVYLDIVGHIPSHEQWKAFIDDKDPAKRSKLIDQLLDDPDYVQNMSTIWSNLLIGRNPPDRTSKNGMMKYLREAFARNRPWNQIVHELLTAEGKFEENGATNFILAQLDGNPNNPEYHVQVTAVATKLFLGMQVQCTQCHNHPFNDWKQNQFWEFNSFFRQVRRNDVEKYNPQTGQMDDDYSELVWMDFSGPVFFENRQALMQVAYPRYFDQDSDPGASTERRKELANRMCKDDPEQQLAQAFVNRTWGHFMGYGFTRPVDDMGPHNAPSHPELLAKLGDEFVKSGYDTKQLIRWICNSESYNLTSQFNDKNRVDDPSVGEVPLFSHMYIKTMNMEQLYDSLIIATAADRAGSGGYDEAQQRRDRMLGEFNRIFGGNDDDEATVFSGSIPQALLMMNGSLVMDAISGKPGTHLAAIGATAGKTNDSALINTLYNTTLGRNATPNELSKLKRYMAPGNRGAFYQDLYWALLNSNEFLVNH